jgi:hypothetical protein
MKRAQKRLKLCRETLRLLTDQEMAEAAGGNISGASCPVCHDTYTCPTWAGCPSYTNAAACC